MVLKFAAGLSAIKRALGSASSPGWHPSVEISLEGDGIDLHQKAGDGDLVVKRLQLSPTGTWSNDQYWSGTFHVALANPPKDGRAMPDTRFEVNIGGRQTPEDILRGLGSHINERSQYGARMKDDWLEILGPTVEKTRPREAGLDRVFADGYIRPAF